MDWISLLLNLLSSSSRFLCSATLYCINLRIFCVRIYDLLSKQSLSTTSRILPCIIKCLKNWASCEAETWIVHFWLIANLSLYSSWFTLNFLLFSLLSCTLILLLLLLFDVSDMLYLEQNLSCHFLYSSTYWMFYVSRSKSDGCLLNDDCEILLWSVAKVKRVCMYTMSEFNQENEEGKKYSTKRNRRKKMITMNRIELKEKVFFSFPREFYQWSFWGDLVDIFFPASTNFLWHNIACIQVEPLWMVIRSPRCHPFLFPVFPCVHARINLWSLAAAPLVILFFLFPPISSSCCATRNEYSYILFESLSQNVWGRIIQLSLDMRDE